MKKISIMLLAALMLFAFVACDDTTKEPAEATIVVPSAAKTIKIGETDVTVADLQKDVKILEDGTVEGTFSYVSIAGWGVAEEDEGYYVAVTVDVEDDEEYKVSNSETTTADSPKTIKGSDNELVCFLGTTDDQAKDATVEIWVPNAEGKFNDKADITLKFTGATFAEKVEADQ